MKSGALKGCSGRDMLTYSSGECSWSLLLNTVFAFAMIYYTDALGLKPHLAGIAMSVAIFWDALSDPLMGYISDNTRSRWGKRHPYFLVGGLGMILFFYLLWYIPGWIRADMNFLFWYLVVINLMQRTFFTVFVVPYVALGFEICTDYAGRTKIQSIRMIMNMAANFFGPALAWRIFFTNSENVRATSNPDSYLAMAGCFSAVALVFLLLMMLGTRKYMTSSKAECRPAARQEGFFKDMKGVLADRYSLYVFLFSFIVMLSVVLISSLQIYLYEHFLRLDAGNKSIAHGGTMIAFALGSATAVYFVSRFQKKGAILFASVLSIACNVTLAVFFLSGLLEPSDRMAFPVFVCFNSLFWLGTGIMLPVTTAMIADVSELNEIKTGINKDGTYSALLSFAIKLASSVATFASGLFLSWIGFNGQAENSPEVLLRLCMVVLLAGPLIAVVAMFAIVKYPVTKDFLEKCRQNKRDVIHSADAASSS